jgi:integrase
MNGLAAKKATIYHRTHLSGNVTWCVFIGKKNDGKRDIRNFPTEEEAKNFADSWNLSLVQRNPQGLSDLSTLSRHEILASIAKLDAFNATLPEAVDFYLKYARPDKGRVTIEEAIRIFLKKKAQLRRSPDYLHNCEKTFFNPFAKAFPGRIAVEVSAAEAEKYVHSHSNWNAVTTASHIKYLRTLYRFLIRHGYAKMNPFESLELPQSAEPSPKVLSIQQTSSLLECALNNGYHAECAAMVLVFFCGVRVDEVERCVWDNIDLQRGKITLSADSTKAGRKRINAIPPNAIAWLKACKNIGSIAPHDYDQRMRRLRRRAGLDYPQNAMRHSFAGYHIARHKNAPATAVLLGHPNPSLLYKTYYELVTEDDAERYWNIYPAKIAKDMDDEARLAAEEQSNCGEAVFADGMWSPIQRESSEQEPDDDACNRSS